MKETEAPLTSKPAWAADFPVDRVEAQHVSVNARVPPTGTSCFLQMRCSLVIGGCGNNLSRTANHALPAA
jgi:hypothetical protein